MEARRAYWALVAAGTAAALLTGASMVQANMGSSALAAHVGADGQIELPADFRTSMVHIGSWFVPEGGASGFHDVFTEKASAEAFRETGAFPDGATLVKELRASEAANYTTGAGVSRATAEVKQWFVMVKDSTGRFPENPIWGEGWGWALFKPEAPMKNVATDYKTDCLACHLPAKQTDWVYTQGYPALGPHR